MPMDHLLNRAASWSALSGRDGHGAPVYGAAAAIAIRFEARDTEIRIAPDQMAHIDAAIFFRPELTVAAKDRIAVSGVNYRVVKIERFDRVDGKPDHFEALVTEEK